MNVLISGASGFIGSALQTHLREVGHTVRVLVRRPVTDTSKEISWDPYQGTLPDNAFEGVDAVINLCGENIASGRWTGSKRERIRKSRVVTTTQLAEAIRSSANGPQLFISASAIGVYGHRPSVVLNESDKPGDGFLAAVCVEWEEAALSAVSDRVRVVVPRIGVVLGKDGGALKKMLPVFKLGLGGRLGAGTQMMSWVSLADVISIFEFLLTHETVTGPVNATAPNAVSNAEFTTTLGSVLSRPTLFPVPGTALRIALGDMADETLLASAQIVPEKLLKAGFHFRHNELRPALEDILS